MGITSRFIYYTLLMIEVLISNHKLKMVLLYTLIYPVVFISNILYDLKRRVK